MKNDPQQPQDPGIAGKSDLHIQAETNVYDSLQAANQIPVQEKKTDIKDLADSLHKENPLKKLRTLEGDLAQNVGKPIPVAPRVVVQSQPTEIADPKRSMYVLGLSGILILGGLIALGFFLIAKFSPNDELVLKPKPGEIIAPDRTQEIHIATGGMSVVEAYREQKTQQPQKSGEFFGLVFTQGQAESKKNLSVQDFTTSLAPTMPASLKRSLQPDFSIGFHDANGWQSYLILKTNSYETAFGGMLSWESTLKQDLAVFLTASATTSSAGIEGNNRAEGNFKDLVIKNKDVRILYNIFNEPLLMYSFFDKETIVITSSVITLEELLARLVTSNFVR